MGRQPYRDVVRDRLLDDLRPGERALGHGLAQGRYLVVTAERVIWSPEIASLPLDTVTRYDEIHESHRCRIVLHHDPAERVETVPRHGFWFLRWGRIRKPVRRRITAFQFSRHTTRAAVALRAELDRRGVSNHLTTVEPARREEARAPLRRPGSC